MQVAASSLAMLEGLVEARSRRVELFRDVFLFHGALGYRIGSHPSGFSEAHRLAVVPLIFMLMPIKALLRKKADELIKPYIAEHLDGLSIASDDSLVSVIKAVADQYYISYMRRQDLGARLGLKKKGISDIRAGNPEAYRRMLTSQCGRCAICGVFFSGTREQTLDHVIPWHLVGDIDDGANWQILCSECNSGKREWFSSLQSAQALNWVYSIQSSALDMPTKETRYVALAHARGCSVPECKQTARSSQLQVVRRLSSGLAVADNVRIVCEHHLEARCLASA